MGQVGLTNIGRGDGGAPCIRFTGRNIMGTVSMGSGRLHLGGNIELGEGGGVVAFITTTPGTGFLFPQLCAF